jgi:hypothetical protein
MNQYPALNALNGAEEILSYDLLANGKDLVVIYLVEMIIGLRSRMCTQ